MIAFLLQKSFALRAALMASSVCLALSSLARAEDHHQPRAPHETAHDNDPCEPPKHREAPAAGHWTGYYRLTYELLIPNVPPTMKFTIKWEGDLSFDVARPPSHEDNPTPPPPRRRPLRPRAPGSAGPSDRAQPGQFSSPEAQIAAAIAAWEKYWQEEENKANAEAETFGNVMMHDGNTGEIKGTAKGSVTTPFGGEISGVTLSGTGGSTTPIECDLKAEETDPEVGFTEIEMIGVIGQMNFSLSGLASGPDGWASTTLTADQSGMRGHGHGESKDGQADIDFVRANPAQSTEKAKIAGLTVEATKCWLMMGPVDSTIMRDRVRSAVAGMDIKVIESEWMATLDERDTAFERRVDQLVADPIPAELTWDYIKHYASEFQSLSSDGKNDYKRCLLTEAKRKGVKITMAGLQELVSRVPRVRDGAKGPVLREWRLRTLPLLRTLGLSGMDACPLLTQADQLFYGEMRELLKQVLEKDHTLKDLSEFAPLLYMGDLGDMQLPYLAAWKKLLPNGPDPFSIPEISVAPEG